MILMCVICATLPIDKKGSSDIPGGPLFYGLSNIQAGGCPRPQDVLVYEDTSFYVKVKPYFDGATKLKSTTECPGVTAAEMLMHKMPPMPLAKSALLFG